jgi:hypothetical protein
MNYNARYSLVPFDKIMMAPQRQMFNYSGLTIQAIWYRNIYDNTLSLRLNDLTNYRTLILTKIVSKGISVIRDKNGIGIFGIFVFDENIDDPKVWLLTESDFNYLGVS